MLTRHFEIAIPEGAALSAPLDVAHVFSEGGQFFQPLWLLTPQSWSPASVTFQASLDGGATWFDLYHEGDEIVAVADGSRMVVLNLPWVPALSHLRLRSGTSVAPVAQATSQVVTITVGAGS